MSNQHQVPSTSTCFMDDPEFESLINSWCDDDFAQTDDSLTDLNNQKTSYNTQISSKDDKADHKNKKTNIMPNSSSNVETSTLSSSFLKLNQTISNETYNFSDLNILIKEKEDLTDKLHNAKGQLKLTQDNLKISLDVSNKEIAKLKQEMYEMKCQSDKTIKTLNSKLEFKEASLHGVQQDFLKLKNNNESLKEGQTSNIKMVSRIRKRVHNNADDNFTKSQIIKFKPNSFEEFDNSFIVSKKTVTKYNHVECQTIINEIPKSTISCATEPDKDLVATLVSDLKKTEVNVTNDQSELSKFFDYSLKISMEDDTRDLLEIPEITLPKECCNGLDYDQMFGCSIKAMQKISLKLQNCRYTNNEIDQNRKYDMEDIVKLLHLQFQKLTIPIRRRNGSIEIILDDILSRKVFKKSQLLVTPQYFCLFQYIYPITKVLDRMFLIASYNPVFLSEFLIDCVLPNLFEIINYLCIQFCCKPKLDCDEASICNTYANNMENHLAEQMLRFITLMVLKSSDSVKNAVFERLFKSFKKLLPIFAAKMELKIVMIQLFCELISFDKMLAMISSHGNGSCIFFIIMDILACTCMLDYDEHQLNQFTQYICLLINSLCGANFKWSPDCDCTTKAFLLLGNIFLCFSKHVMANGWTTANKDCIQNILITCRQLKDSCGPEIYYQLSQLNLCVEFKFNLEYIIDFEHPLMLEDVWPYEYEMFVELVKNSGLKNTK